MTKAMLTSVWSTLPTTCPVRNEARDIAIVRKRLTMPSVISAQTPTAVTRAPEVAAMRMMPGAT